MSNATQRNFGAAQRERDRRVGLALDGSLPVGSLAVTGDPGWDAFFGSLHDKEAEARAAGMNFRADLGGIGRWAEPSTSGMRVDPNAQNYALGRLAEESGARRMALKQAADANVDSAIADMQGSYDRHVMDSVGQPAIEPTVINRTPGQNGNGDAYVVQRDPSAPPDERTEREKFVARLPGSMRIGADAALSPLDRADETQALAVRKQDEAERAARANEAIAGASVLSPDAIDENADLYLQTGKMPTLGMKDPGNRAKILNRAAEKAAANGGGNVAANTADYKADSASLVKLQQQRDAVGAFESTALKNLDVFLDLAKKVPDTGSPGINTPLRAASERLFGDDSLAAYNAARRTVIPEFAKILSNPTLSGQLSDSARHEVEEVLNGGATLKQTIAVANLLKRDAENRRTSYDDQLKTVRGRIDKSNKPAPNGGGALKRLRYDMNGNPIKD